MASSNSRVSLRVHPFFARSRLTRGDLLDYRLGVRLNSFEDFITQIIPVGVIACLHLYWIRLGVLRHCRDTLVALTEIGGVNNPLTSTVKREHGSDNSMCIVLQGSAQTVLEFFEDCGVLVRW